MIGLLSSIFCSSSTLSLRLIGGLPPLAWDFLKFGARSRKATGSRRSHRSTGSDTWESAEIISSSGFCTVPERPDCIAVLIKQSPLYGACFSVYYSGHERQG